MGHVKWLTYTKNVMFGLLRKSKFSLEKLSLNSLMLLLDTMGISSPVWVPADRQTRQADKTGRQTRQADKTGRQDRQTQTERQDRQTRQKEKTGRKTDRQDKQRKTERQETDQKRAD